MGHDALNAKRLSEQLAQVGTSLGQREAAHADELAVAWRHADALHALVAEGLESFHAAARDAGATHLEIALNEPKLDTKHVRAVELELSRGRHRAIITVKSKGEITLVGPFRSGKQEGPCQSFPFAAEAELQQALGGFLERFLEAATSP